mmetsp:Transcript_2908/g.8357  ORF Transcript_2908/g.8357 Transcript_2908/m.8357 type:complete len:245 (-) Transcript_2908:241-975(-)
MEEARSDIAIALILRRGEVNLFRSGIDSEVNQVIHLNDADAIGGNLQIRFANADARSFWEDLLRQLYRAQAHRASGEGVAQVERDSVTHVVFEHGRDTHDTLRDDRFHCEAAHKNLPHGDFEEGQVGDPDRLQRAPIAHAGVAEQRRPHGREHGHRSVGRVETLKHLLLASYRPLVRGQHQRPVKADAPERQMHIRHKLHNTRRKVATIADERLHERTRRIRYVGGVTLVVRPVGAETPVRIFN